MVCNILRFTDSNLHGCTTPDPTLQGNYQHHCLAFIQEARTVFNHIPIASTSNYSTEHMHLVMREDKNKTRAATQDNKFLLN